MPLLVLACSSRSPSSASRTALRAPDRFGMLLATGVTVWVIAQARGEHRRRGRRAAGVGDPAAVRVVRRLVARVHDARGRDPRQRRAQAGAGDGTSMRRPHERRGRLRARSPGAAPAATCTRRSPSPTSSCAAGTIASASCGSSARGAASRRPPSRRPGTRSTCCPGRGLRRSLRPSALLGERRSACVGHAARVRACASGSSGACARASCSASAGTRRCRVRRSRRGSGGSRWSCTSRTRRRAW